MKIIDLTVSIRNWMVEQFNHRVDPTILFKEFISNTFKCELGYICDDYWPSFLIFNDEVQYTLFLMKLPPGVN